MNENTAITWKEIFRGGYKSVVILVISAVVGLLLLMGVYLIPIAPIEANVEASAINFQEEKFPQEMEFLGINGSLDNFTNALMLLHAGYSGEQTVLQKAINVYSDDVDGYDPNQVIIAKYIDGAETILHTYGRYWHGYLVIIKPLLVFFTYEDILTLNMAAVVVTIGIIVITMLKKGLKKYIIPYVVSVLLLNPLAIGHSFQLSTSYYVFTIAIFVFLLKKEWLKASSERLYLFFVVVGCATSYFDFLTYPFVTFGIPLVLHLCVNKKKIGETLKDMFWVMIFWFVGYGGMWAEKWILGTLLGEENVIKMAMGKIATRTSMTAFEVDFSYFDIITKQIERIKGPLWIVIFLYLIITGVLILKKYWKEKKNDWMWISYIAATGLPFLWYAISGNHSYIHKFTYREMVIAVFAVMCLFARYAVNNNKKE